MQKTIRSVCFGLLLTLSCSLYSMEQNNSSKSTMEKVIATRQSTRVTRSRSQECVVVHHDTPQITRKQKSQDVMANMDLLDSLVLDTRKPKESKEITLADICKEDEADGNDILQSAIEDELAYKAGMYRLIELAVEMNLEEKRQEYTALSSGIELTLEEKKQKMKAVIAAVDAEFMARQENDCVLESAVQSTVKTKEQELSLAQALVEVQTFDQLEPAICLTHLLEQANQKNNGF